MTASDQTAPVQLIQKRQTRFNRTELSAIYEYATNLPASDSYGDGIGRAIITELVDSNEGQNADEVFRRLESISDDVSAFFRALYAIHYGHLEVEEKLAEVNQVLSQLNAERLEDETAEEKSW